MSEVIAGFRLVEKNEMIKEGDVAGWAKKIPIDMKIWNNSLAGNFNQPVYRPMSSFKDYKA